MTSARVFLTLSVLLLTSTDASAREWTDNTGKFRVEADFAGFDLYGWEWDEHGVEREIDLHKQVVLLKKQDGSTIKVPVARLSRPDVEFLEVMDVICVPRRLKSRDGEGMRYNVTDVVLDGQHDRVYSGRTAHPLSWFDDETQQQLRRVTAEHLDAKKRWKEGMRKEFESKAGAQLALRQPPSKPAVQKEEDDGLAKLVVGVVAALVIGKAIVDKLPSGSSSSNRSGSTGLDANAASSNHVQIRVKVLEQSLGRFAPVHGVVVHITDWPGSKSQTTTTAGTVSLNQLKKYTKVWIGDDRGKGLRNTELWKGNLKNNLDITVRIRKSGEIEIDRSEY